MIIFNEKALFSTLPINLQQKGVKGEVHGNLISASYLVKKA